MNMFTLLDSDARTKATDAQVTKATDTKAVKAQADALIAQVRDALAKAETPEAFAKVVANVAEIGHTEDLRRQALATKAASQVMARVTRVVIREAFVRSLIGKDRLYPSQRALADAVGVSPAYVTACKPTPKDSTKAKGGKASAEAREDSKATDTTKALDTTDAPLVAIARTLTTLERQTKALVVTPENRDDVERLANALESMARHLHLTAKPAKATA